MQEFFRIAAISVVSSILFGCASQEKLTLPVQLAIAKNEMRAKINWVDERPASDRERTELPTAIGYLVTLGDDVSNPPVAEYLQRRLGIESQSKLDGRTVVIKRLKATAESRNSWALLGYRQPSTVGSYVFEKKGMPNDYKSKVEVQVLIEVDGATYSALSSIPYEYRPSALDITNAIKAAVDNLVSALPR